MVRAQRVHGDQQDVRSLGVTRRAGAGSQGQAEAEQPREESRGAHLAESIEARDAETARIAPRRRAAGRCAAVAGLVLAVAGLGCGTVAQWRVELRESERRAAEDNARSSLRHRDWDRALASLERAQAAPYLSPRFAFESTLQKARTLEELGRHEESLAHFRYLRDRYPDTIAADQVPEEALALEPDDASLPTPSPEPEVHVPEPRYPRPASWAGVGGSVQVRYRINAKGRPEEIRIVGPAHPLLASFAIEAVAGARLRHREDRSALPGVWDVRFSFDAERVPKVVSGTRRVTAR